MEVIKDSAPVDKRKLDPNKVGKVLLRGLSALSHKRKEERRSPLQLLCSNTKALKETTQHRVSVSRGVKVSVTGLAW